MHNSEHAYLTSVSACCQHRLCPVTHMPEQLSQAPTTIPRELAWREERTLVCMVPAMGGQTKASMASLSSRAEVLTKSDLISENVLLSRDLIFASWDDWHGMHHERRGSLRGLLPRLPQYLQLLMVSLIHSTGCFSPCVSVQS